MMLLANNMDKELTKAVKELLIQLKNEHLSEFSDASIEKVELLLKAADNTDLDDVTRLTECSKCGSTYYLNSSKTDGHNCG